MRKLLRGNELAYYFEKLGIQKGQGKNGGDRHMLGDDEAARNMLTDAEHQLAVTEIDHVMEDNINLEEFGLYDVAYHDKSRYRNPYKDLNTGPGGWGKKQEQLLDESVFQEPIPEMDDDAKRILVKDRASYHYHYAAPKMVVIRPRRENDEGENSDGESVGGWSDGLFGADDDSYRKPTIRKYVYIPLSTEGGVREEILKVARGLERQKALFGAIGARARRTWNKWFQLEPEQVNWLNSNAVVLSNVHKVYGDQGGFTRLKRSHTHAVKGVCGAPFDDTKVDADDKKKKNTVEEQDNHVFGLLGTNGSGKTSLFKMLLGLEPVTSGGVFVLGKEVSRDCEAIRRQVGYCPQANTLINSSDMTVREIVEYFFRLKNAKQTSAHYAAAVKADEKHWTGDVKDRNAANAIEDDDEHVEREPKRHNRRSLAEGSSGKARKGKNGKGRKGNRDKALEDAVNFVDTAREYCDVVAELQKRASEREARTVNALLGQFDLLEYAERAVANLSGGNVRKLMLALAFIGDPALIFLDEPTAGIDPVARRKIWNLIKKQANTKFVVSTHIVEEAEALCSSVAMQGEGSWKVFGQVPELRRRFCTNMYQVTLRLDVKPLSLSLDVDTKKLSNSAARWHEYVNKFVRDHDIEHEYETDRFITMSKKKKRKLKNFIYKDDD